MLRSSPKCLGNPLGMAPPMIQVNGATPSSKMIISPPRLNLRRASSYNHADRGPSSSTSSRFGFEHLIFNSPPPSPGLPLPQQAPRMRNPSSTPRPSRVFRFLLWLSGAIFILYVATNSLRHGQVVPVLTWTRTTDEEYEMVGQDDLPDFPTPIVVTDRKGRAKWTVSMPPSYDFPLTTVEYSDICAKCKEVSSRVSALHGRSSINQIPLMGGGGGDSGTEPYFLDVKEAEEQRFLSGIAAKQSGRGGGLLGVDGNSLVDKPVCESSLTFVMESDDAGLGKTLMSLWLSYGLAKREGRAFFIEDTRWAYGEHSAIFEAPPAPPCQPPPRHEMIPCPRQARHLIVSSANTREIFGAKIPDEDIYSEGPAAGLDRRPEQRELFHLAREGYEALFCLNSQDREYVSSRVHEHRAKSLAAEGEAHNGKIVGVHVRRGDRHPLEFQYGDSYIPLMQYVGAAQSILNETLGDDDVAKGKSFLVLASDDPLVYDADELRGTSWVRAQEQIRLAGKEQVDDQASARPDKTVMHKFVDETFGWEGGFFAPMFWNLGLSSTSAANAGGTRDIRTRLPPDAETIRLRSLFGRAYLMDLAVLADLSEGGGVVCAVSAMGCRLLAVMMGWERAMARGEWRNIDGGFGWNGVAW